MHNVLRGALRGFSLAYVALRDRQGAQNIHQHLRVNRRRNLAAVVVGAMDGLCAWLLYWRLAHISAMTLFQGIGRALLGKAAFASGATENAIGEGSVRRLEPPTGCSFTAP
jgi:hypothetical protein